MDRVLIVEDNPVLLKILQSGMKKYEDRFSAVTARDGEEAIEILRKDPVSLLVTDLQMPKVDGLTLLAYMNDHHPEIPCVVMSAHGTPQIKEKISRDVLRFIEKPFEIEELVDTILPALEGDEPVGTLNGISISNFLQMIHMEQKTCLLEIETPDGRKGYFYFEEGVLFDAVYEDLTGEQAALEIIPHDRAKIRFKNLAKGKKQVTRRIEKDLMALLMDAMRLKDEADAQAGRSTASEDFTGIDEPSEAPVGDGDEDFEEEFELVDFEMEDPTEGRMAPAEAETADPPPPVAPTRLGSSAAADRSQTTPSSEMVSVLHGLRDVAGYRGSAVLDESGEMLVQDAAEPGLDMELFAAVLIDLIRAGRKVAAETELAAVTELMLAAESGVMLCVCGDRTAEDSFHALVLLGAEGNRAMARIALKKILPALKAALA